MTASISGNASVSPQAMKVVLLAAATLIPRPENREVTEQDVCQDGLLPSIRIRGVIVPLIVRKLGDGRYEVVAGHRRLFCVNLLGIKEVPCVVLEGEVKDAQVMELSLCENEIRKKLSPVELAQDITRWIRLTGCTQSEVAAKLGLHPATVSRALSIKRLAPDLRSLVENFTVKPVVACLVASLETLEQQREVMRRAVDERLTRDQVARIVAHYKDSRKKVKKPKALKGKIDGRSFALELRPTDNAECVAELLRGVASKLLKNRDVHPEGWRYQVFSRN